MVSSWRLKLLRASSNNLLIDYYDVPSLQDDQVKRAEEKDIGCCDQCCNLKLKLRIKMIRDTCQANNAEFVIWNTEAWISKHRWSAHLKPLGINLLKKRIRRKIEQSCNENLKSWNIQCNFFLIVLVQCKQFSVIISYLHNLPRSPWSSTEINF